MRTIHGAGGGVKYAIFGQKLSNIPAKPLDFRASNGQNIRARDFSPPPPPEPNLSRTPMCKTLRLAELTSKKQMSSLPNGKNGGATRQLTRKEGKKKKKRPSHRNFCFSAHFIIVYNRHRLIKNDKGVRIFPWFSWVRGILKFTERWETPFLWTKYKNTKKVFERRQFRMAMTCNQTHHGIEYRDNSHGPGNSMLRW